MGVRGAGRRACHCRSRRCHAGQAGRAGAFRGCRPRRPNPASRMPFWCDRPQHGAAALGGGGAAHADGTGARPAGAGFGVDGVDLQRRQVGHHEQQQWRPLAGREFDAAAQRGGEVGLRDVGTSAHARQQRGVGLVRQHAALEQVLEIGERHASAPSAQSAASSARRAISRICASSAKSSAKGGNWSSRSIIEGTAPNVRRTCANKSQTSSQTG